MLLGVLIWAVAAIVAAGFAWKRWWFPSPINAHAVAFDSYFTLNLVLTGVVFLAAQFALGWLILRHRHRGQTARHHPGSNRLEILWTSITTILFLGAAVASARMWTEVHFASFQTAPLQVDVVAKQFAWNFRYAGRDGKFGKTDTKMANDAAGNPFGIVGGDPAGKDDVVSSALRIPAGRPVRMLLHSHDVIHSFFVRELRVKQDIVPGMEIPLRIEADKPGEYEIACAELCGLGHHQMRSVLMVMPQAEFDAWLARQR